MSIALLSGQSSNGSGAAVTLNAKEGGNKIGLSAFGTFGSGTITIELALDGTNYTAVTTFTAAAYKMIEIVAEAGSKIRATLSGATGPNVTVLMSGAFTGITRTDA